MCVFVYIYINSNPTKHCITNPRERKKKKGKNYAKPYFYIYFTNERKPKQELL